MNNETLEMFRTLTELPGAPGFEHEVRRFVRAELSKVTEEIVQDRLGSIFGVLRGDAQGPKVLVNGHMDEVGFMVTAINEQGMIRFKTLGGWWSQVLPAQRMQIITKNGPVIGVIGSTPPHLLDESQRSKPIDINTMFLDIGADNKEDALAIGIMPGQQIVPICPFTSLANPKKIMAKAWDNRFGVGLALELLKEMKGKAHPNILYSGATVQEEVGLRGAQTAAGLVNPDICFTVDCGPANDATGDKNAFGHLGKGTVMRLMDASIVPNRTLIEFMLDTAESNKIPYQFFVSNGGTDAGRIHQHGIGVPTAALGLCGRYIHTSASIIHVDDYAASKELLVKLVEKMDWTTLHTITENV